ncbi:possible high light inducible protein [Prochlorococcus marinus str. MIT 9515]|uniref:Possible high light inducible protein n=1 Tax=Prochlorococcus marinus (strain MIT 9515) TaxID=167542 RepID=A2BY24_PROM5|nr:high light inducible protein [Prochlorococcus marinus]ABM72685.1 possible high light inducible protein [Prochlorococcus marinus str. MIT 9515]
MKEEIPKIENKNENSDNTSTENLNQDINNKSSDSEYSKWVDNQGDEVKNVFGFNSSAELVNGRAAMVGFFMLLLTELVLKGRPVTSSIFGIN